MKLQAKTNSKSDSPIANPQHALTSRIKALVVATGDAQALIEKTLRFHDVEIYPAARYGAMAAALFDDSDPGQPERQIFFVLDLRASCGTSVIDTRLADYDAVLNAYIMSGHVWPMTLCLVEPGQTRPAWLQERPHLRATLLADEVETVIGHPQQLAGCPNLAKAVKHCLS